MRDAGAEHLSVLTLAISVTKRLPPHFWNWTMTPLIHVLKALGKR